jgi:hypothetical protein
MRLAAIATGCLLLAGCAEYTDLSPDAFMKMPENREQRAFDTRACQQRAEAERSYSVRGLQADAGESHRIYSNALASCMASLGYERRTGWYDFWEGYDW